MGLIFFKKNKKLQCPKKEKERGRKYKVIARNVLFFLICLFIYDCSRSLLLCAGSLQLWRAGAASRLQQLQFPGSRAQGQWLWPTGLTAPQNAESFQIRD